MKVFGGILILLALALGAKAQTMLGPIVDTTNCSGGTQIGYLTAAGTLGCSNPLNKIVQAATVNTDASGNWSVTWALPFATATPSISVDPITTRSATAAAGRCFQNSLVFLSLLGINISAAPVNYATSSVSILARESTQ